MAADTKDGTQPGGTDAPASTHSEVTGDAGPPFIGSIRGRYWWDGTQWRRLDQRAGESGVYQMVVVALIGIILIVIVGTLVAVLLGKTVPAAIIAIAGSAATGLVGILAPSPLSHGAGGDALPSGPGSQPSGGLAPGAPSGGTPAPA